MAKRGSQQRNGLNRNASNKKQTASESGHGCVSDKKDKTNLQKDLSSDRNTNCDPQHGSSNNIDARLHNVKNSGSVKKSTDRTTSVSWQEITGDETINLTTPVDSANKTGAVLGSDIKSDSLKESGDFGTSVAEICDGSSSRVGTSVSSLPNVIEGYLCSLTWAGKRLESLALFIINAAKGWLERQKPHMLSIATRACIVRDYICARVKIVSPIIWSWCLHTGKFFLLLFLVWLNCTVRGLGSLLRLGTSSFFVVIWCSLFSLIGIVGIAKVLMFTVVAALSLIFVGSSLAILLSIIFSSVMLWLRGSFWSTGLVVLLGGVAFALKHERVALFLFTGYSMYCAKSNMGWMGLLLGANFSFITSDVALYLLRNSMAESGFRSPPEGRQNRHGASHFYGAPGFSSKVENVNQGAYESRNDRSAGQPSTSGTEAELTSEDEVARLLNCSDHYTALGLARFADIDVASLKKEYRRKAMLVHPDKNMGNEIAAEAFKKLQNAYEVLLDSLKRKTYDDELRREELLNYLRRFQTSSFQNGRNSTFDSEFAHFEAAEMEGSSGAFRRIACDRCKMFHIWMLTERLKSHARWCEDCKEFHQAKDGDGWLEQGSQPLLFGLVRKMGPRTAYICKDSRIYDVTPWFLCQGLACPANTHKPSFHVNTSVASRNNPARGNSAHRTSGSMPSSIVDENMTEEEFLEWLQNLAQSGMFGASNTQPESPYTRSSGGGSKSNIKKKRKGKKQW